ncbi:MAG: hypothetical protein ACLUDD_04995 [Lactobacillus kalixensis]|uniref:hypothetical protein n=1 Tax=Lactobacillus kalixensis TaxID=227944 RepID=UPI003993E931
MRNFSEAEKLLKQLGFKVNDFNAEFKKQMDYYDKDKIFEMQQNAKKVAFPIPTQEHNFVYYSGLKFTSAKGNPFFVSGVLDENNRGCIVTFDWKTGINITKNELTEFVDFLAETAHAAIIVDLSSQSVTKMLMDEKALEEIQEACGDRPPIIYLDKYDESKRAEIVKKLNRDLNNKGA